MELTKDDFYEIEKALDVYAGFINTELNKFCQTSIHYEAINKDKSPLNKAIVGLKDASDRIKEIRDKLQTRRNEK